MRMTEKIAYIKGLAEGLELDSSKNEVKIINQILELLDQMAAEVEELQDCYDDEENPLYEITCPQCDSKFTSDEDSIVTGEVECPECGAVLEFDFSDLEEDHHHDGCCCGCGADEHYGEDDLMS